MRFRKASMSSASSGVAPAGVEASRFVSPAGLFFPGGGACQRLPRLIGYQMARELVLTGRRWDAAEAKSLGLVNRVVPQARVVEEAMEMARRIASYPSTGVVQAKRALNHAMEAGLAAGLRFDTEAWVACMHSDEWKQKLEGFARNERKA